MLERLVGTGLLTVVLSGCATAGSTGTPAAKLSVGFNDTAWDGARVPDGMQCARQGGREPASPPLLVSGIPPNSARVIVEFNDESYAPLSKDGGHGTFAVDVTGRDEVIVPPFTEGQATGLGSGVSIVANNRGGTGPGYLAPCSGKQDHLYSVTVHAMSAGNQELARGYAPLGKY